MSYKLVKIFGILQALNLLYFRASSNYEFLEESLGEVAESDKMVRGMLDIIRDVIREDGYKRQPINVNWMRAVSGGFRLCIGHLKPKFFLFFEVFPNAFKNSFYGPIYISFFNFLSPISENSAVLIKCLIN